MSGLPAGFQSGGARGYQVASMEPKAETVSNADVLFRKQLMLQIRLFLRNTLDSTPVAF